MERTVTVTVAVTEGNSEHVNVSQDVVTLNDWVPIVAARLFMRSATIGRYNMLPATVVNAAYETPGSQLHQDKVLHAIAALRHATADFCDPSEGMKIVVDVKKLFPEVEGQCEEDINSDRHQYDYMTHEIDRNGLGGIVEFTNVPTWLKDDDVHSTVEDGNSSDES